MANTEDLRYVRTEHAIRSAFMALVAEGPAASVTASALCRRAGISRNAFYLHYASVYTLYATLVNELVADVSAECRDSTQRIAATQSLDDLLFPAIINAFGRHEELLRALLPVDDGSLAKCLAEGLEDAYVDASLTVSANASSFRHRLNCAFTAWAHVGMIVRWISQTEQPLAEAIPLFVSLQTGLSASITDFLLQGIESDARAEHAPYNGMHATTAHKEP